MIYYFLIDYQLLVDISKKFPLCPEVFSINHFILNFNLFLNGNLLFVVEILLENTLTSKANHLAEVMAWSPLTSVVFVVSS